MPGNPAGEERLLPQSQFLDELLVALGSGGGQILQQATPLAHHFQQTSAGGVIFGVRLEVLSQMIEPRRQ